ncbi:MAG: hypothetical protein IJ576_09260 [Synergistaceae bacterium]|nr:hypothetical protein [Synergistaceae bacterium]
MRFNYNSDLNNNINNNDLSLSSSVKELLTRELELCRKLRAMISRELEVIVLDNDMDALLKILNQKSEVISEMQLLADSWLDVINYNNEDSSADLNNKNFNLNSEGFVAGKILAMFPDNDEIKLLIDQTRDIADSIMKAEDQAPAELEKYAAGLRSQMASRTHTRNAAAAYSKMGGSLI